MCYRPILCSLTFCGSDCFESPYSFSLIPNISVYKIFDARSLSSAGLRYSTWCLLVLALLPENTEIAYYACQACNIHGHGSFVGDRNTPTGCACFVGVVASIIAVLRIHRNVSEVVGWGCMAPNCASGGKSRYPMPVRDGAASPLLGLMMMGKPSKGAEGEGSASSDGESQSRTSGSMLSLMFRL
jgi:hypothetical protein